MRMKIEGIKIGDGNIPLVSATVDGVRCDVSREVGALVIRPVAWDRAHEIVASGDNVPAELREAYERSVENARRFARGVKPRPAITIVHPDLLDDDK